MSETKQIVTEQNAHVDQDLPRHWFVRGMAVGLLLTGAMNALSYFFRSANWSSLVGPSGSFEDSIGFPWKMWEAGNTYGGMFVDYPMLGANVLCALLLGTGIGVVVARQTDPLNRMMEEFKQRGGKRRNQPIQFSLRGIMIVTACMAVIAMIARLFLSRPETLIAIYVAGPLALVSIAMLPKRIKWEKRVAIIIPTTLALIAVAVVVGNRLGMEFDRVLLGIFVCWTPQSALAAFGLTTAILVAYARDRANTAETPLANEGSRQT